MELATDAYGAAHDRVSDGRLRVFLLERVQDSRRRLGADPARHCRVHTYEHLEARTGNAETHSAGRVAPTRSVSSGCCETQTAPRSRDPSVHYFDRCSRSG